MSTGLKAIGITGIGALLAIGVLAYEPESAVTSSPSPIVVPTQTTKKADTTSVTKPKTQPKPAAPKAPTSNCHPNYSGCLKMNAGDYDCAGGSGNGPNYTGTVRVYGADPFGLDRDGDGWGCE